MREGVASTHFPPKPREAVSVNGRIILISFLFFFFFFVLLPLESGTSGLK